MNFNTILIALITLFTINGWTHELFDQDIHKEWVPCVFASSTIDEHEGTAFEEHITIIFPSIEPGVFNPKEGYCSHDKEGVSFRFREKERVRKEESILSVINRLLDEEKEQGDLCQWQLLHQSYNESQNEGELFFVSPSKERSAHLKIIKSSYFIYLLITETSGIIYKDEITNSTNIFFEKIKKFNNSFKVLGLNKIKKK